MADETRADAVQIPAHGQILDGELTIPPGAGAVVLFAHGSGSSRHSPRNQYVAAALNDVGFATLLMDLLTADEDAVDRRTRELRFDILRLSERLTAAVDWLAADERTAPLPVFLYGASTGAAAALITAAERSQRIRGTVSRGGRPDLAGDALGRLCTPTLLIVGGRDPTVLELNERAQQAIRTSGGEAELVIVPGATHLFDEPGALDAVIDVTVDRMRHWATPGSGA